MSAITGGTSLVGSTTPSAASLTLAARRPYASTGVPGLSAAMSHTLGRIRPSLGYKMQLSRASELVAAAGMPDRQSEHGLSEATCLGICWVLLLAFSACAILTRNLGPSGAPPLSVARQILASGLAAAMGEAAFYPVEVAKVRLQRPGGPRRSLLGELRTLVTEAGSSSKLVA